ncbi:MAG: endonuclease domain-containing protein [Fusobacteriaceae bacterium]|nr:endonuclease domain-containing protein [Fusobacteriaceae bacterium]MBU9919195.1 endonuclease domain-containing protein [Fusobacteriaceae bacterium]
MGIYNEKILESRRRDLRVKQTEAEKILWQKLRNRQINGFKFFRQCSIGKYIADFYCSELRLVIELDGSHHYEENVFEYDKIREEFMKSLDIQTIRFNNLDVFKSLDEVMERVYFEVRKSSNSL